MALVGELGARLPHPRLVIDRARQTLAERGARLAAARGVTRRAMAEHAGRLTELAGRARLAIARKAIETRERLGALAQLLESCSYQRVLERGFALVSDSAGDPVTTAASARRERALDLRFRDGAVGVRVEGDAARPRAGAATPRRGKERQGTLL
jgi:exodeoxyribonuclease VII large subunit